MYIVDFNKLKIEKEFRLTKISQELEVGNAAAKQVMKDIFNSLPTHTDIEFHFYLNTPATYEIGDFVSSVNAILAYFFHYLILPTGRKREHRLAVPLELQGLHASLSALKKAINYETKCDRFNIFIHGNNDLFYVFCDDKQPLDAADSSFELNTEE